MSIHLPKHAPSLLEVLLVDSDAHACARLEGLLEAHSIRTISVHGMEAAREALRAIYFPLIILDRDLPDGDAMALCREHRVRQNNRRVRILMLAATQTDEDAELALSSGADEYLSKATTDHVLATRIRQLYSSVMRKPAMRVAIDAETERLRALDDYDILDSEPEQAFDDITTIASAVCQTPIAAISLIGEERQWFKSRKGIDSQEQPLEHSFCAHAIERPDEVLIIEDATGDSRFASNPLVTSDPQVRFYAGAPLVSAEGHALGTVCVADHRPRQLDRAALDALQALSRQVMALLEKRRMQKKLDDAAIAQRTSDADLARSESLFREAYENTAVGIALVSLTGQWLRVNRAVCTLLGYSEEQMLRVDFQSLTHADDLDKDLDQVRELLSGKIKSYEMEKRYLHKRGHTVWALINVSLVRDAADRPVYFVSQIIDIGQRKRTEESRAQYVSRASHKLRSTAHEVCGALEQMTSGEAGELPAKSQVMGRFAQHKAETLHRLLDDLLDAQQFEPVVSLRARQAG